MLYPLIFEQVSDGYVVAVPDIDGCYSAGDTLEETYSNVKQAIALHLESVVKDGGEIPTPTAIENHKNDPDLDGHNVFFGVIDVDLSHLMGKAEKINITLPSYLIKRIDDFVAVHKEYKNRSNFLAKIAADKILTA
ncbi:type II toxin-antitoxin system HicB family antitoxin [Glaesserella parasuis]|nr:type II toxin-antitoxin system HicB family antitoxin [Glaesserella parasuis]MDO9960568.1 type II toxin-antitoxin system HicB family antitoxin [Glaesserella parasuis]MDP0341049.1 type II toxin-antitoxin system HicB family antitoxin [Glaesserella parasuis]MDP0356354.1 type II toxin-antitoxin system HicB family antitoxin [Glaesserella parasuis]